MSLYISLLSHWAWRLVLVALGLSTIAGFAPAHPYQQPQMRSALHFDSSRVCHLSPAYRRLRPLYERKDDEDDEDIDVSDQDWRAFRAKMVMTEKSFEPEQKAAPIMEEDDLDGIGAVFTSAISNTTESEEESTTSSTSLSSKKMTPLDPSQWAYDSGKVIEQGAIILGGVEQDYGFALRQQYFHKTAILVLDHDENQFTKGIILNRPSDILMEDDINKGVKWRVWFGGDVQGLDSPNPDIVCLHTLKTEKAVKSSVSVINDIQWTSFDNAKQLVNAGLATVEDFWVFGGYAGWGSGQLMGEVGRKSWYMVATDSQTLLKELARQSANADPRDAGLETWTLLMNMIGRGETAEECKGDFDDLVLKEWARENLLSLEAGGGAGMQLSKGETNVLETNTIDRLMKRISDATRGEVINEGSFVRASSADRSPFLLSTQEYHKSVVLIIMDDENLSLGVILNRPAAKSVKLNGSSKTSGETNEEKIALRYGGQYAIKGQESLLWLHCCDHLKDANVGSEIGKDEAGIWKCTSQDVTNAIAQGLAKPEDFLAVSGVSVWSKGGRVLDNGMDGEIKKGKFEFIPKSRTRDVWNTILKQEMLTNMNLLQYVKAANEAWNLGGERDSKNQKGKTVPIGGLGEGFDEDDDSLVFNSAVKVSKLSDDTLKSWIATFLLGLPTLGKS